MNINFYYRTNLFKILLSSLLLSIFIASFLFSLPVTQTHSISNISTPSILLDTETQEPLNPILSYSIDIDFQSAMVIEDNRGTRLYLKNQHEQTTIPITAKIMTAIIAIEALSSNTTITLSNVAAREPDAYLLSLRAGERYSLEYLLYGMLLRNNDAAAVALAEQVAGTQENFIEQMNERATGYGLVNTRFRNCTGQYNESQYSTIDDTGKLIRYALSIPKFKEIIGTKDRPFFLAEDETRHLISNFELAWNLLEGIRGTLKADSNGYSSFFTLVSGSSMNLIILGVSSTENTIAQNLEKISASIFDDYEVTTLVRSGQSFPKTIYIEEDSFGLNFNSTITYIRPINTEFIKSTTYEEFENIEYPILTSEPVAKVTFEFLDGTSISADLYPNTTIYGKQNYYNILLSVYNENKTIGNIIIILSTIFVLVGIFKLFRAIVVLIVRSSRKD